MPDKDDVKVGIGGENKRLKSALDQSKVLVSQFANVGKSSLGVFDRALKGTFSNVFSLNGIIGTLAGTGGLGFLINSANDSASEIGKLADTAGVGVEALQEMSHAARMAGVDIEATVDGVKELQLRADEFAVTGKGSAAEAFARLGMSREQVAERLQRPLDLMEDIIDGVGELNQAAQIRIFDELFGGTAAEQFTRFLRDGIGSVAELRQEARDLGLVLDSVMVREAQRSEAQLAKVGAVLRTNVTRAVLALTPQIIALAEGFTQHLQPAVQWLVRNLPDAAVASDELARRMAVLQEQIEAVAGMSLDDALNLDSITAIDEDRRNEFLELIEDYVRLNELLEERKRKEALVKTAIEGSTTAQTDQSFKIKEVAEALQFEIDQLGRSEAQQRLYSEAQKAGIEVHGAFAASIEPLVNRLAEEKAALEATTAAAKELADAEAERARAAQTVFEQTRTPMESYQARLVELNDLQDRGLISWETYGRAVEQAEAKMERATEKTAVLGNAVSDLGRAGLRGNMQTWDDWGNFAVDKILQVTNAWIESQLTIAQTSSGGGGFLDFLTTGISAIFSFGASNASASFANAGGAIPGASPGFVPGLTPRAKGGPVFRGQSYLVGEEGLPELFVPQSSGHVFSGSDTAKMLGAGRGAGMTVNMTLNNPTRDMIPGIMAALQAVGADVRRVDNGLERRAVTAVANARGRDPELFGGAV